MATVYKLSHTAKEIDDKLTAIDNLVIDSNQADCLKMVHNQAFKRIAHRGYYLDNGVEANSLESLKASVLNGYNMVECDVSVTGYKTDYNAETDNPLDAERQIVVKHDISYTDEDGVRICYANLPYSQCGEPVLFEDFVNQAKVIGAHLYLDIKQIDTDILDWGKQGNTTRDDIVNSYLKPIVEIVENAGMMNNVTFMAARSTYLKYIVSSGWLNKNYCRVGIVAEALPATQPDDPEGAKNGTYLINMINSLKESNETSLVALNVSYKDFTDELYDELISAGIYLEVWTSVAYTEEEIKNIIVKCPKLKGITCNIPKESTLTYKILSKLPVWEGGNY